MEFKDYYQILGVESDADTPSIKSAYRKLARKYHPDLNPAKDAESRFKEVAEAWEVLKDKQRRAEYDELYRYGGRSQNDFEPPPGWQSSAQSTENFNGDFSDFFSSVFGKGFSSDGSRGFHSEGLRGRDVEIEMPIFLEETISALSKPISYELPVIENGQLRQRSKSLKVKIPAGVADGERIRLQGQGAPGQGDAPPGDLYLHVRLVPHPIFDVEGRNLFVTVAISPWEAALGTKVTVPTLDGKIRLTVARNSQTGQKLRVRGKGLVGKTGNGDLFAVLRVVMPDHSSPKMDKLWRELAEEAAFDPRADWVGNAGGDS